MEEEILAAAVIAQCLVDLEAFGESVGEHNLTPGFYPTERLRAQWRDAKSAYNWLTDFTGENDYRTSIIEALELDTERVSCVAGTSFNWLMPHFR